MQNDTSELDQLQSAYKAAVEESIAAIKQEETLASVNHSVAEVDQWETGTLRRRQNSQQGESCEEEIRRRAAREVLWLLNRNNAYHNGDARIGLVRICAGARGNCVPGKHFDCVG